MKRLAAILMFAVTASSPGYAQQFESMREQGDRLCRNDATRLCRPVLNQGDFAILGCFQANATKLSRGCRQFLQEQGQLPR